MVSRTAPQKKKTVKKTPPRSRVLLVTGMSGAGHSTALGALADMGYAVIDNLPISLVEPLLQRRPAQGRPVAIGIDSRTWDFTAARFLRQVQVLRARKDIDVGFLFLDCQDDVLQQRFTETRRVHPLAVDRPVREGVLAERQMMRPVRGEADRVIDTSAVRPRDLRDLLAAHFPVEKPRGLSVLVTSFGFKNGLPRESDMVFDVRFLDNPYWDKQLRPLSGLDKKVAQKIRKDKGYGAFFRQMTAYLATVLPRYAQEGRPYLTVAVGCTGGRHRSVFVSEELKRWMEKTGFSADVRHRDMESWAAAHRAEVPAKKKTAHRAEVPAKKKTATRKRVKK